MTDANSHALAIRRRLGSLRIQLLSAGIDALIIPDTDPHASEYVPDYWKCRQWISGFEGSAGTVVVTADAAALWTDSRYFLAAADVLADTGIELMKSGLPDTPSIETWLLVQLGNTAEKATQSRNVSDMTVGVNGSVISIEATMHYEEALSAHRVKFKDVGDLFTAIWRERPELPQSPISIHPLEYAGASVEDKIASVLSRIAESGADALLVSALDEVAWILNLRGADVAYNPVFISYLLVTASGDSILFVDEEKVSDAVRLHLDAAHVSITNYDSVGDRLREYSRTHVLMVSKELNIKLYRQPLSPPIIHRGISVVGSMKAVKTESEIAGFRRSMIRDGVAMIRFLRTLPDYVASGTDTEYTAGARLTAIRAESREFCSDSFATIAGYGANGAIVHYEAEAHTAATLQPRGLLLVDSGAQYVDGTTDITRTIALGEVSEEERHAYTLVLKGHIALSCCRFPEGMSGTNLDLAARYAMWQEGLNYGHGTGHGVGACLNVHEGPHQIRMNYMPAPLLAGMTVTNEPGLYFAGKFGIRTENVLLVVSDRTTEFGSFLRFEPLTLCPIDLSPIDFGMLTSDEISWINDYHAHVREVLLPHVHDETDRLWLINATENV